MSLCVAVGRGLLALHGVGAACLAYLVGEGGVCGGKGARHLTSLCVICFHATRFIRQNYWKTNSIMVVTYILYQVCRLLLPLDGFQVWRWRKLRVASIGEYLGHILWLFHFLEKHMDSFSVILGEK